MHVGPKIDARPPSRLEAAMPATETLRLRIRDRLVDLGKEALDSRVRPVPVFADPEADALIRDLDRYPHAFVVACVMDLGVKSEEAWGAPAELRRRLGTFELNRLCVLSEEDIRRAMTEPTVLHRYREKVPARVHRALLRIRDVHKGNAANIWTGKPSSAAIVRRFLEFDGVGQKIATMAANILVRHFRIPVSDHYSIDVSVDTHVRRVMTRLGLIPPESSVEEIVYTARELHPEYPGIFDSALWDIGRGFCHPRKPPECTRCAMTQLCPREGVQAS